MKNVTITKPMIATFIIALSGVGLMIISDLTGYEPLKPIGTYISHIGYAVFSTWVILKL